MMSREFKISRNLLLPLAIVTLAFTSGYAGRPPKILENPVASLVPRNEPVTLNCKAEGDPTPEITWLKDGKPLRSSDSRGLRLFLPSGSLFFLRVRKDHDSGVYACQAENKYGQALSRNATLDVATLRDEFRSSPQNTWVAQGETAILECEPPRGNPEPKVSWKKNGQAIDLKANVRYRIVGLGSLSISQVRSNDEGRYVCSAKNIVGIRQSSAALLRVTVRPQFTIVPANTSALIGSDISLSCVARGDPPPEITWKKQRGSLPLKRSHFDDERFRISNAEEGDEGVYACIAENKAGSIVSSASVDILAPPVLVLTPDNVELQPNTTGIFRCQSGGDPPPTLFWSREGSHSVVFQGASSGNLKVDEDGTLQIDNVGERDEGKYLCAAVSPAGSAMYKAELKVTAIEELPPPIINMGPSNQTKPAGSVAILPCVAQGHPSPVITWYKNTNSFTLDHRVFVDDKGTLRINDLRREDSGLYECVASSRSGKYVWRAYLQIEPSSSDIRKSHHSPSPTPPMRPHIVNVDSTSVTFAWHPKYFRFSASVTGVDNNILERPPPPPPISKADSSDQFFEFRQKSKAKKESSNSGKYRSDEDEDEDEDMMVEDEAVEFNSKNSNKVVKSDEERQRKLNIWEPKSKPNSEENVPEEIQLSSKNPKYEEDSGVPAWNFDLFDEDNEESEDDEDDSDDDDDVIKDYREEKTNFQVGIEQVEVEEVNQISTSVSEAVEVPVFKNTHAPATSSTPTPSTSVSSKPTNEVTYKIEYYSVDEIRTEWMLAATNVQNEIFTLQYLKPNAEYVFFVRSVSHDGIVSFPSPMSRVVTLKGNKQSADELSAAMGGLEQVVLVLKHGYATSSTSARIEWQIVNAAKYIEGFYIYYRQVAKKDEPGTYQMLTALNTGATTFQISGLDKFSTYQIFLLPFYKNVDGRPSNYVIVETSQDVPSAPPEFLDTIPVNSTAIVVRWKPPPTRHHNGVILGYQLRIWSGAALITNLTTNGSTTSLLLNNLTTGQYSLQIGSFTSRGVGTFSSMKSLYFRQDNYVPNVAPLPNPNKTPSGKQKEKDSDKIPPFVKGNEIDASEYDRDRDVRPIDGSATPNYQNEFLTEVWFIGLIGSIVFIMLLVFVFMLYMRRCSLRQNGEKLKVSAADIPDGSMPPHYPDDNLWIDSQQTKHSQQHTLKSNSNHVNEYENGNNYAVVEDRSHSPIPYATTTLVNGEKHLRISSYNVFNDPAKQTGGSRRNDFGMNPKMMGWAAGNNKTASLNICAQDMKKDMTKNTSLNVLTTFQTPPLSTRKQHNIIVDFSNGQSINSVLHYHEPRLNGSQSNYNSHSHSNNHTAC